MPRQKKYGPKMAKPRIWRSKERRHCGPIGRYIKAKKGEFTSVLPHTKFSPKIGYFVYGKDT